MQFSMSMRLPEEINNELAELAKATGRTKSFLAVEAVKEFLAREKWQIEKIQQGLAEADQGLFATDDEIKALHEKWGYNAEYLHSTLGWKTPNQVHTKIKILS
jgi:predicted transcriptional regulator